MHGAAWLRCLDGVLRPRRQRWNVALDHQAGSKQGDTDPASKMEQYLEDNVRLVQLLYNRCAAE